MSYPTKARLVKSILIVLSTLLLFSSCKKVLDHAVDRSSSIQKDGFTEYVIEAGANYTTANGYKPISNRKEMHFLALLDSNCIYTSANPANQGDINKLYGFSDCNSTHQESSARVGWNWNGHAFDLYAYCYVNSNRQSKLLGSVQPMQQLDLSIRITENKYIFLINGKEGTMDRECSTESIEGYQLYPYFGGDEPAPHRMTVYIKEL
jgi:hypothetical protein